MKYGSPPLGGWGDSNAFMYSSVAEAFTKKPAPKGGTGYTLKNVKPKSLYSLGVWVS